MACKAFRRYSKRSERFVTLAMSSSRSSRSSATSLCSCTESARTSLTMSYSVKMSSASPTNSFVPPSGYAKSRCKLSLPGASGGKDAALCQTASIIARSSSDSMLRSSLSCLTDLSNELRCSSNRQRVASISCESSENRCSRLHAMSATSRVMRACSSAIRSQRLSRSSRSTSASCSGSEAGPAVKAGAAGVAGSPLALTALGPRLAVASRSFSSCSAARSSATSEHRAKRSCLTELAISCRNLSTAAAAVAGSGL
mmetsp:Transcript_27956/g.76860  ORF Transcript_27956/g.76860 Transcript_27956/m.76860 type:complete len:256 (+) Transcript_27956:649-1416(+)